MPKQLKFLKINLKLFDNIDDLQVDVKTPALIQMKMKTTHR